MAYDHELADRIRRVVSRKKGVTEKEMFGGIAFLLSGKMFVGIVKQDLMVRLDPETWEQVLARPHARPMDFTGRPMKGYVYVAPAGVKSDEALAAWIERGHDFVARLPERGSKPKKPKRPTKPTKVSRQKR